MAEAGGEAKIKDGEGQRTGMLVQLGSYVILTKQIILLFSDFY